MKLFLIGFMGSGKSYLSKKIAQRRNLDFIDLDNWIEEKAQLCIAEIFRQSGEVGFRDWETKALKAMQARDNIVVACGGGTPCFNNNMNLINKMGLSVYLRTPVSLLLQRLGSETAHRPLLAGKSAEELEDFVRYQLKKRTYFYEKAHLIFDQHSNNPEELDRLDSLISSHLKKN